MALTKKQIEKFKHQLVEMRAHLTTQLSGQEAAVKVPEEGRGYSQHQADEGTDDFDRRISIELTSQERDLVRKIDRALEKIEEDSYGQCDVTGQEIPIKRLEAIPYASMTRDAQEQMEKGLLS